MLVRVTAVVAASLLWLIQSLNSSHTAFAQEVEKDSNWAGGFEIVLAKPLFGRNLAYRRVGQPSPNRVEIQDVEFESSYEASPRVWVGYETQEGIGIRTSWWQYANETDLESARPSANGFERLEHPVLGDVDISAITPTESLLTQSSLEAYTIDLEITKQAEVGAWLLIPFAGIRHASLRQSYLAQLLGNTNQLVGEVDYRQRTYGFGPTLGVETRRALSDRLAVTAVGRASLLAGTGDSLLVGGEDLDFVNPLRTRQEARRDQLLPILETRLAVNYMARQIGPAQWWMHGGWEVQWWGDVANATGTPADLGFVGLSLGTSILW